MFHNCSINNKTNHLHEGVLHIAYNDFKSSFETPLEKESAKTCNRNAWDNENRFCTSNGWTILLES